MELCTFIDLKIKDAGIPLSGVCVTRHGEIRLDFPPEATKKHREDANKIAKDSKSAYKKPILPAEMVKRLKKKDIDDVLPVMVAYYLLENPELAARLGISIFED